MGLSNRTTAIFLLVFSIFIIFSTFNFISNLTGLAGQQQAQVSVIIAPICGDNLVTSGENCDGTNLTGRTCVTQGFDGGTLSCLSDCSGFDTSLCTNVTEAEEVILTGTQQIRGGGTIGSLVYNADIYPTYDFAATTVRVIIIIFKKENYYVRITTFDESSAKVSITDPEGEISYVNFLLGQTKPIDLDKDGKLDLFFTLEDILTRRVVFHLEVFKEILSSQAPGKIQEPKTELPAKEVDLARYYVESVIVLLLLLLAVINFGLFKKHILDTKS
ncbi:MAG: hypothetical protein Q8R00_01530 [Candidatus Nanoarchaeia archaeon]|nr:hypothetical protein [Candidatus Nanoarchaeia archaeon]